MDTMNKKIKDERHRSMAKLVALAERDGEEIIIISAQRGGAVRVSGSSTAHDLVMLWKATATARRLKTSDEIAASRRQQSL
jgi:hypothetical protein